MSQDRPSFPAYVPPAPAPAPTAEPVGPSALAALPLEAARERAISLLTDGYAYDVIAEAEFERRLAHLIRADTPAEIGALVADLTTPSLAAPGPRSSPMMLVPDHGRISAIMSETRREGPWRVPQHLKLVAIMANVRLDLRYAAVPQGCRIEVTAFMASVTVIVPPGLTVDLDVMPIMGNVRNDAVDVQNVGYQLPSIHVGGSAIMAEVRARVRGLGR